MPQYLIVHKIESFPDSQEEWIGIWRDLRQRACGDALWLHSFYEPSTEKLYCEWQAPDLEAITSCLEEEMLEIAPIISASEVVLFDVAWLDEND